MQVASEFEITPADGISLQRGECVSSGMLRSYKADLFRLTRPHTTVKEGVASHNFNAANDADAVKAAMVLHGAQYNPATDQVIVWELRPGKEDRGVKIVEGPYTPRA